MFSSNKKQIKQIDIDSEIIPGVGVGELELGMNCFSLKEIYSENFKGERNSYYEGYDKGYWKYELDKPFLVSLNITYKDYITLSINPFNGRISTIHVKNNYKGKIFNIAGLGDTTRKLYEKSKSLNYPFNEFIEGQFFFMNKKRFGSSIYVGDYDLECDNEQHFEQLLDLPIKEIAISDYKLREPCF